MLAAAFLTPLLLNIAVYNTAAAQERTVGDSTIELDGQISIAGHSPVKLQRRFAGAQAMQFTASSVAAPVAALMKSRFDDLEITDITLDLSSNDGSKTALLERIGDAPELGQRIGPDSDLVVAELVHAVEAEHARTLADILRRRTMAGLAADLGRRDAPLAAGWLARLTIWDSARVAAELAAYRESLRRFAVPGRPFTDLR